MFGYKKIAAAICIQLVYLESIIERYLNGDRSTRAKLIFRSFYNITYLRAYLSKYMYYRMWVVIAIALEICETAGVLVNSIRVNIERAVREKKFTFENSPVRKFSGK